MEIKRKPGAQPGNHNRLVHGLKGTRIYNIWKGMKERCYTVTATKYKNYGAKGIKVCSEWEHDAKAFFDWAMENGYADNLTIDRIDICGDYSPDNCRWVDLTAQANNRTNNVLISHNGEMISLSEFCRINNLHYKTFYQNYRTRHNSLEVSMQRASIKRKGDR